MRRAPLRSPAVVARGTPISSETSLMLVPSTPCSANTAAAAGNLYAIAGGTARGIGNSVWTWHVQPAGSPAGGEDHGTLKGTDGAAQHSADDDEDGEDDDSDASSLGGIQLGGPKPGEQPKPNGDDDEEEEHDPFGLPPSDDEEEMAELRRRVLASKPFTNPTKPAENTNDDTDPKAPERIQRAGPAGMPADSDAESGSDIGDNDDDEFDNIMNAAPMTDRAGISAAKRKKQMEKDGKLSVRFSRAEISAPVKGQ